MSLFDEPVRRALRLSLVDSGVAPERADLGVDLACHAADRATAAFADVLQRIAPTDAALRLLVTEIGAQLAAGHFTRLAETLLRLATIVGATSREVDITLKGSTHG